MKKKEVLFLWDGENWNPNGDMLRDNAPRFDEISEIAEVTDVRIKRTIRDEILKSDEASIFVKEYKDGDSVMDAKKAIRTRINVDQSEGEIKKMDQKQRDLMEEVKAIIAEGGDNNQPTEPIEQPAVESNKEEAKEATPDIKAGDNKTQENNENNETKSDKEVASLQDELLKGKSIADLEETAAGGNAAAGSYFSTRK